MFFGGESKHPSLPLARAERKPFDHKKKHPPRYQRENLLKENPAYCNSALTPCATSAKSHLKETQPCCNSKNQTLNRNSMTSPSFTTYSLPSVRCRPLALTAA